MELRPELCPPVAPEQRIADLSTAKATIAKLLERGESADSAIAAFNAGTGHAYTAYDFRIYGSLVTSGTLRSRRPTRFAEGRERHPRRAD